MKFTMILNEKIIADAMKATGLKKRAEVIHLDLIEIINKAASPHYSPDFVARRPRCLKMRRKMENLLAALFNMLREQIFHFTQQIQVDRSSQ